MFIVLSLSVFFVLIDLAPLMHSKPLSFDDTTEEANMSNETVRRIRQTDIIFPESEEEPLVVLPILDGPPECAGGNTFCENFDPYPRHQLKDILAKHSVNRAIFGVDEPPEEVSSRDDNEDIFVCGSLERTIFPKIGKNKRNKWKLIVNQEEEGFVQGVRIETCRSFGKPCDVIGDVPNGYVTSCKQKYIYRRLLSLNDDGVPFHDTFQLPSACCCSYRRNVEFWVRFGFSYRRG